MNWFNSLSGSRARAKELETENASLVAARDSAVAALSSERESNTAALAALKTEIATLTEANAAMSRDVESAIADAAKAKADAAKDTADFEAKVKAEGAKQAQVVIASLGVPPVLQTGDQSKSGPQTKTRAEFEALDHSARNSFIASGGKLKD